MNSTTSISAECHTPGNVLFLIPQSARQGGRVTFAHSIHAMARALAQENFVYVAREGQSHCEDDEHGVRHLPLEKDRIPCFGRLTTVYVAGDEALAVAVATEHPEASVFVMYASEGRHSATVARKMSAWATDTRPALPFVRKPASLPHWARPTAH